MICPYCGESIREPWEYFKKNEDVDGLICPCCSEEFDASIHITHRYSTSKVNEVEE